VILALALVVLQIPGSGLAAGSADAALVAVRQERVAVLRTAAPLPDAASVRPEIPVTPAIALVIPAPHPQRRPLTPPNRKAWVALTLIQHSAATFDAWTTRHKLEQGGYRETNPLLKPFANNASLYVAVQGLPFAADFAAKRLQTSQRPIIRRLWWLPQAVQTVTSMYFGISNLRK
jgi:hypothetical protein